MHKKKREFEHELNVEMPRSLRKYRRQHKMDPQIALVLREEVLRTALVQLNKKYLPAINTAIAKADKAAVAEETKQEEIARLDQELEQNSSRIEINKIYASWSRSN